MDPRLVVQHTIRGEPFPYERPGLAVNRTTGRAVMFTQKATREHMKLLTQELALVCRHPETSLDVEVWLTFRRQGRGRVDVDNLAKTVLDACKGVVWKDDSQVVSLHIVKRLGCGREAGTDLVVRRILGHELVDAAPEDG